AARHLESAHEGAHRAAALTSRLLAFARETAINPEPICADALFSGLSDLLSRTLGDGVTVTFDDDSQGWCTRADRVQLENVIVNLAVNARDAMAGLLVAGTALTQGTNLVLFLVTAFWMKPVPVPPGEEKVALH
ncbi:hypothetical protein LTR94_031510, partial [Friedmanniomyces endolithicus]